MMSRALYTHIMYYVLKDLNEYNRMHLVTMSPWKFEVNRKIDAYNQMLSDLTALDSILYYDRNTVLNALEQSSAVMKAFDYAREYLGGLMPKFLNSIYEMKGKSCFFDFASLTYVPLESSFNKINLSKKDKLDTEIKFPVNRLSSTLGLVCPPSYPEDDKYVKEEIERPVARLDGKKICNVLRE